MAVTALTLGYTPTTGIDYTHTTDTSADFATVPNDTYFYNLEDKLPYYKDANGNIVKIFGTLTFTSSTAAPTTTELPNDKDTSIHKDTSGGTVYLAYNDGGVIKTVTLT